MFDLVIQTEQRSCTSMRPLGDYVLGYEACLLARCAHLAILIPAQPIEYNTDAVLPWCYAKHTRALRTALEAVAYPDGASVYQFPDDVPHYRERAHAYKPGETPFDREERVWETFEEDAAVELQAGLHHVLDRCYEQIKKRGCCIRAFPGSG